MMSNRVCLLLLFCLLGTVACTEPADDPRVGAKHVLLFIYDDDYHGVVPELQLGQAVAMICMYGYDAAAWRRENGDSDSSAFFLTAGVTAESSDPAVATFARDITGECVQPMVSVTGRTTLVIKAADGNEIDHLDITVK